MIMLKFVLIVIALSLGLKKYIDRELVVLIPTSIMIIGIILYLFGLAGKLSIGYWTIISLAILVVLYEGYMCLKNKVAFLALVRDIFSPGVCIFSLICILILILDSGKTVGTWDEIMQWAPFVKESYRTNRLFADYNSNVMIHKAYFPMASLIQYFFCRIGGNYSDDFLFMATHATGLSFFMPLFKNESWTSLKIKKDYIRLIFSSIIILFLPIMIGFGEGDFYSTIYINGMMAMMLTYLLLFSYHMDINSRDEWIIFITAIVFASLIKDDSITLALFALTAVLLRILTECAGKQYPWIMLVVSMLIMLVVRKMYSIYLTIMKVKESFDVNIDIRVLVDVFLNKADDVHQEIFKGYIDFLITENLINLGRGNIKLSFVQLLLFMGVIFSFYCLSKSVVTAKEIISFFYVLLVCLGGAFVVLLVELFVFSKGFSNYDSANQFLIAYCVPRYLNTYVVGCVNTIIIYTIKGIENNNIQLKWNTIMVGIIGLLFLSPELYQSFYKQNYLESEYIKQAEYIKRNVKEGENVYIYTPTLGDTPRMELYNLLISNQNRYDPYASFEENYAEYEYIYISNLDTDNLDYYKTWNCEGEDLETNQIYRIEITKTGFELKKM